MIEENDVLKIGRLTKTHGVGGEMIFIFTSDIFDTDECQFLFLKLDGIFVPFFIEEYRFRSDYSAIIKFEGIDDVETAARYKGTEVYCDRQLGGTEAGSHVHVDGLIGYEVYDTRQGLVGKATAIDTQTENILLFIEDNNGNEVIIPLHDDLIDQIDDARHTITFNLPDGIIDTGMAGTLD